MDKLKEIKNHYDNSYIEDYGDYETITIDKKDYDWLIDTIDRQKSIIKDLKSNLCEVINESKCTDTKNSLIKVLTKLKEFDQKKY